MVLACLFAFVLAACLSWLLSGQLGRFGFLDHPNARSSHQRSTPRGGGLAFIGATLLVSPLLATQALQGGAALLLIPLPLALVGVLDDRLGLSARLRLLVQLLTALALALATGWSLPAACVGAVFAAGVINAINFMDGLDGLVAGSMAVWLLLAAVLLHLPLLLPLVAALLGFLLSNWSPARLFMGDVGSTFLGALMAGALLLALRLAPGPIALPLLLAALPLLGDASTCLLRRWLAGQPIWQAHRLHLYQRLQQAGWSHQRVATLYLGAIAALAFLAWLSQPWPLAIAASVQAFAALSVVALGIGLERRVAVPFNGR